MIDKGGHWRQVSLDELGSWQGGLTPSKRVTAYWTDGSMPWVSPKDFGEMTIEDSIDKITDIAVAESGISVLPPGSLLIVTRSGVLRHSLPTAVTSKSVTINQDVKALLPSPGIRPRFLQYQLEAVADKILQSAVKAGTTVESVDSDALRRFPIMIAGRLEQDRVVGLLDEVFAKLDECAATVSIARAGIETLKSSALNAAFTGELTATWREKHEVAGEWRHVSLADVAVKISYGSSKKSATAGDVAVVRMGNIQAGKLVWNDLVYTSDESEIQKHLLLNGDVLFNRTNSPELVGKTAVYNSERPAIAAGYLIVVRCSGEIIPDILAYFLNSPAGRAYCWTVKSDGVSQSNINAKKLAAFEFNLPSLEEQQELVSKLKKVFELIEATYDSLSEVALSLQEVRRRILRSVFHGNNYGDDSSDEIDNLLNEAKAFRDNYKMRTRDRKISMASPMPLDEQIASILQAYGPDGATFEEIRGKISVDYETLRTGIFALLQVKPPRLRQVFDQQGRIIRLKVAQE